MVSLKKSKARYFPLDTGNLNEPVEQLYIVCLYLNASHQIMVIFPYDHNCGVL